LSDNVATEDVRIVRANNQTCLPPLPRPTFQPCDHLGPKLEINHASPTKANQPIGNDAICHTTLEAPEEFILDAYRS